MTIREEIIAAIDRWKMDDRELEEATGLDRSTINRYRRGVCDLTGEKIDRLLNALSLQIRPHVRAVRLNNLKINQHVPPSNRYPRKRRTKTKAKKRPAGEDIFD